MNTQKALSGSKHLSYFKGGRSKLLEEMKDQVILGRDLIQEWLDILF